MYFFTASYSKAAVSQLERYRGSVKATLVILLTLSLFSCETAESRPPAPEIAQALAQQQPLDPNDTGFEAFQTQKLLGVPVKAFPHGPTLFDELPTSATAFNFNLMQRPSSGAKPRASYETREKVQARAPDGTLYEAYLGNDDPQEIVPGNRVVSTPENTRQRYGTHHGYAYNPQDVFIGRREGGRLKATLFFRDVGSHTTAPHSLAIDAKKQAHLVVADVNIFQDNRLELYWVIGDLASGKWAEAWLVDRRGFTSWSHPWMGAWGDKVYLLWNWCDVSIHKDAPGMGLFFVEWSPGGFGRKLRIISGVVRKLDAAIDSQSGRLLIAFSREEMMVRTLTFTSFRGQRTERGRGRRGCPRHLGSGPILQSKRRGQRPSSSERVRRRIESGYSSPSSVHEGVRLHR